MHTTTAVPFLFVARWLRCRCRLKPRYNTAPLEIITTVLIDDKLSYLTSAVVALMCKSRACKAGDIIAEGSTSLVCGHVSWTLWVHADA